VGDGEQDSRRRRKERIGAGQARESVAVSQGRKDGRASIRIAIEGIAFSIRPEGRADPREKPVIPTRSQNQFGQLVTLH
jgi:hypothetical protein